MRIGSLVELDWRMGALTAFMWPGGGAETPALSQRHTQPPLLLRPLWLLARQLHTLKARQVRMLAALRLPIRFSAHAVLRESATPTRTSMESSVILR